MVKYKCPTVGDCDKANSGEVFEHSPGDDLKCPECGTLLVEQTPASAPSGGKKTPLIAAVAATIALVAGGGYFYTRPATPAVEPVAIAPPVPASNPAPLPSTKPSEPGLAPSDAETREMRVSGDTKLTQGDAAGAELASSKAAANETLKVAIAKMAQGKLDEAEKDFNEARARNPKQSLVYYNMAILRLRQGKADDALKELEASF